VTWKSVSRLKVITGTHLSKQVLDGVVTATYLIILSLVRVAIRRGLDWTLDLLTTSIHNS
jgi:hypothetical protein